jgi:hypothetical protein
MPDYAWADSAVVAAVIVVMGVSIATIVAGALVVLSIEAMEPRVRALRRWLRT